MTKFLAEREGGGMGKRDNEKRRQATSRYYMQVSGTAPDDRWTRGIRVAEQGHTHTNTHTRTHTSFNLGLFHDVCRVDPRT
jgi:hypothetical protein